MSLMAVYIVLLFIGQAIAFAIGAAFDMVSKTVGLFVFLGLYFAVFVICWKIAIRLTAPGSYISARLSR